MNDQQLTESALKLMSSIATKKILEVALGAVNSFLKSKNATLLQEPKDINLSISNHFKAALDWSDELSFNYLNDKFKLSEFYVPLNLYDQVSRNTFKGEKINLHTLDDLLYDSRHIFILGKPGSGKTTALRRIANQLITDESTYRRYFTCPIVVRLREFGTSISSPSLTDYFSTVLGLHIKWEDNTKHIDQLSSVLREALIAMMNSMKLFILIDGFDELPTIEIKEKILKELSQYARDLYECKIILTCRTGDVDFYIGSMKKYEVANLNQQQIEEFICNWIPDNIKAQEMIQQLKNSKILGLETRPLTLSHLCVLFSRTGHLPSNKREVYEKFTNLVIEDWDIERMVQRESKFKDFRALKKKTFLSYLSFYLTTTLNGASVFTLKQIQKVYNLINDRYGEMFKLSPTDLKIVLDELENHSGLFNKTSGDQYEFYHKSLQEYLTASFIIGLPEIPKDNELLHMLPDELAIAIALSTDATMYFSYLILNRFQDKRFFYNNYLNPFLDRIILESPEFTVSAHLGLSVLKIFTQLQEFKKDSAQYSDNYNVMLKKFHLFIKTFPVVKSSISKVQHYYREDPLQVTNATAVYKKHFTIDEFHPDVEPETLIVPHELTYLLIEGVN